MCIQADYWWGWAGATEEEVITEKLDICVGAGLCFGKQRKAHKVIRCHVTFFAGLFCNKILKKISSLTPSIKNGFCFLIS